MTEPALLWPGGPRLCPDGAFPPGTDSILLADFIRPGAAARGIDLGCGSGLLTLLLAHKSERLRMIGLEIRESAVRAARETLRLNALEERASVVEGDIRRCRELFAAGSFDLVAANPPYFALGAGAVSPRDGRAAARAETDCTLAQLADAAAWLCRTGGSFSLVYRPERLAELTVCLSARGLEPKRLRFVCHRADSAPSLVLLEARRGGRPGLRVEPMLILELPDGSESPEYKRIYHREETT
ncbi:MAG: methyltransferase [Oscillospiraceae bacterium]|nr:methyltransferase [Oscillospiraceae bacterium]